MAKRNLQTESTPKKKFKLSNKATTRLNKYLAEIRKGIANVCELHTHDSAPSMSQEDFEEVYVERVLSQTVASVSASIRSMMEALQAQKEREMQARMKEENKPAEGKEDHS